MFIIRPNIFITLVVAVVSMISDNNPEKKAMNPDKVHRMIPPKLLKPARKIIQLTPSVRVNSNDKNKNVTMAPSAVKFASAEKYPKNVHQRVNSNDKDNNVSQKGAVTPPIQTQIDHRHNKMQHTTSKPSLKTPTIENNAMLQQEKSSSTRIIYDWPDIHDRGDTNNDIVALSTKGQLQTKVILDNINPSDGKGGTIYFFCEKSYCYEIDKSTGEKIYYICSQLYCRIAFSEKNEADTVPTLPLVFLTKHEE